MYHLLLYIQKAVEFACGNALLCDTIEVARKVAFGVPERRKVTMLFYYLKSILYYNTRVLLIGCAYLCIISFAPQDCVAGWYLVSEVWSDIWRC